MGQISLSEQGVKKAIKRFQQWERERQKKQNPSISDADLFKLSEAQEAFSQWMGQKSFHDLTQALSRPEAMMGAGPGSGVESELSAKDARELLAEIASLAREAKAERVMATGSIASGPIARGFFATGPIEIGPAERGGAGPKDQGGSKSSLERKASESLNEAKRALEPRREVDFAIAKGANPFFAKASPREAALMLRIQNGSESSSEKRQEQSVFQAIGEALESLGRWSGASCESIRESLSWSGARALAKEAMGSGFQSGRDLMKVLSPPDFSDDGDGAVQSRQRAAYGAIAARVNAALDLWESLESRDPWLLAPSGEIIEMAERYSGALIKVARAGEAARVSDALALISANLFSIDVINPSLIQAQLIGVGKSLALGMGDMRALSLICPKG